VDAGETPVVKLEALGVRGILWQLARDGQIIDVRCEMPQCYCFRGRSYFEPRSTLSKWSPTADHYPRLKMHGGHLTPDNVRLAHRLCNQRDYIWRKKINALLGKRMSLEEIAEKLNLENVPTIHGTNRWTAASVRKAFVPRSALEGNEVRSRAGALSRGSELVESQHEFLDLG
jgi:DNA-binding transcriptional MerR regulator